MEKPKLIYARFDWDGENVTVKLPKNKKQEESPGYLFSLEQKGGPGSGNFGHGGRPGKVGGSGSSSEDKNKYIVGAKDPSVSAIFKKGQEDKFIESLTTEESKALNEYKGDDPYAAGAAIALNGMLRDGSKLSDDQTKALEQIDSAFQKAPRLKEETTLYRGTDEMMLSKNGYIDTKAFISTSVKRDEAENFAGLVSGGKGYLYEIKVPKNFVAMPTSHFHSASTIAEEGEVVLPRGVAIKISSMSGRVIKCEVVGGEAWMIRPMKEIGLQTIFKQHPDYEEYQLPKSIGLGTIFKFDVAQPRDEDGKWTSTGRGSSLVSAQSRESLPDHIKELKIPPAWTDLRYSEDPDADLLATGRDKKGRLQPVYSGRFMAQNAEAKFERVKELIGKYGSIHSQNEANANSKDLSVRENALCLSLVMETGIRPGSGKDTGAEKQAYGATTLLGQHVVVSGGNVSLQFVGKKGVSLDIPVQDSGLKKLLIERAKSAGSDGKLFDVSDKSLREYTHTLDGGSFKPKDMRTRLATETAMGEVKKFKSSPANEKEYKKMVKEVAIVVSKKLGNTPTVALQSYIYPGVFSQWRSKVELKESK